MASLGVLNLVAAAVSFWFAGYSRQMGETSAFWVFLGAYNIAAAAAAFFIF